METKFSLLNLLLFSQHYRKIMRAINVKLAKLLNVVYRSRENIIEYNDANSCCSIRYYNYSQFYPLHKFMLLTDTYQ